MTPTHTKLLIDEQFCPALIKIIDLAKKEILLSTFKFQSSNKPYARKLMSLHAALIAARYRGVNVKILTNIHHGPNLLPHQNRLATQLLEESGILVRGTTLSRIVHGKICIIDTERFIIGSHNITAKALRSNFECSMLVESRELSEELRARFITVWEGSQE